MEIHKETLAEFEHAFKTKTETDRERLVTKTIFTLGQITKKYESVTSDLLSPEVISNVVVDRKREIIQNFLKRQLSGMNYEEILGLEIAINFYAKSLYKDAAAVAIEKKDYPTLSACINNLVNWGYRKEAIEIVKTIEDSEDLPESLRDMIKLANPKIPQC